MAAHCSGRLESRVAARLHAVESLPALVTMLGMATKTASCAFCDIIQGNKSSHLVFEDSSSIAFLDNRPVFQGHCLLVPRQHYETLLDLPGELVGPLFMNSQLLAGAVQQAMGADGTFVAMNNRISQSVPHLHIHVVPRRKKDGLKGFFWPRHPYESDAAAEATREAIRKAVEELHKLR